MKSILLYRFSAFVILVMLAINSNGQVCGRHLNKQDVQDIQNLIGTWEGHITYNGSTHVLRIVISMQGDALGAEISDQSTKEKELSAAVSLCSAGKYHFYGFLSNGQQFRYNPRWKDGQLSGTFQVGDVCPRVKPEFSLTRLR